MRHVVLMTLAGVIGISMLFLVDLIDLFYLSHLKQTAVTAAIGYAGTIVLLNLSLAIGGSVAAAALVARNMGAGNLVQARQYATSALLFSLIMSSLLTICIAFGSSSFLSLLGAEGDAKRLAQSFIWTLSPGYIFIGGEVCCVAILRALGDVRRSMYISVAAAFVTFCADPIFIFGLGLQIQGAAVATTLGHLAAFSIGVHKLVKVHKFLNPLGLGGLKRDIPSIWQIAYPAILAQLTLPFSNTYVTHLMANFGDEFVAGFATVCRIIPVAYSVIYSITGSVGPIIGQNYGAKQINRVRQTITNSLIFSVGYALTTSFILFFCRFQIASVFHATGHNLEVIVFFCKFIAVSWVFVGAQFLANAVFNNLGHPKLSLVLNWGRATFGTVPFALIGAKLGGWEGLLIGNAIGTAIFGVVSIIIAYTIVNKSGN